MESKKIINICGVPHTITEHEDVFNVDTHFGMIDYAKCEIRINKNMPDASKQETLCHEVLHGILVHIGRNDLSTDEAFVQSLSNAIYQTFTPNVETRACTKSLKSWRESRPHRMWQGRRRRATRRVCCVTMAGTRRSEEGL